jgi:dATP pyrophosphohydrolase
MARAAFNILVLPYRRLLAETQFAVFHRPQPEMWQFIAGGGEDGETPSAAARREAFEEAGIACGTGWTDLDSQASIPRTAFPGAPWPAEVLVVTEYSFAVDASDCEILLSHEHDRFEWLEYQEAHDRLTWDSNKVALWELHERIRTQRLSNTRLHPTPL